MQLTLNQNITFLCMLIIVTKRGDIHENILYNHNIETFLKDKSFFPHRSEFEPRLFIIIKGQTMETLLNGKAQYSWPPWTNQFRSDAFDNATIT